MTVAAAAVALVALSAAPVSGEFRYVAPAEVEAAAELAEPPEPEKSENAGEADIDSAPGSGPAVLDPGVAATSVWRVYEGEMLRAVLARWAGRAGSEVLFLTDRRYRLDGDAAFEGGFTDAVQALFRSLSLLPHPPVAARSECGTTLVVRHRMPRSGGNEAVP
ncbi:MAG: TcpQ domain-containing protein [Rhodospirillales bacterium]|nr:TcpQ domain-containing protein [Rhodospirillales bacterium]MDE0381598.1 TcpQ domain-containing protein [Rhodospirillales bacterium]